MKILILIVTCCGWSAHAGWMANADFSSCPRKYIPNTSGQEGPFGSQADCRARIDQAQREMRLDCARYTCVEAGDTAPTGVGASGTADQQLDTAIQQSISAGMNGQISGGDAAALVTLGLMGKALVGSANNAQRPPTPEELADQRERQRLAVERARQEEERQRLAEAAYQIRQDEESLGSLSAAVQFMKFTPQDRPPSQNFRAKILCKGGEPGLHTCHVMVCGGAYNGDPICCPEGFPKLNECDCNCYPANADFECKRYAACQYSYDANKSGAK